jgi:multidrug efflux system membrane fusion protein
MIFVRSNTAASPHGRRMGPGALAMAACLALSTACSQGGAAGATAAPAAGAPGGRAGGGRAGGAVAVTTASVVTKSMAVRVRVVGNVEPSSTVNVRAQVQGELLKVHFTEGQDVSAGDVLFSIDPSPFESTLKQVQANLARDTANSQNAEAQLTRSADLLKRGLVAQSQHDVLVAQAAALRATLDADAAQVHTAQIQLKESKVVAPITGRTGAILAHPGSLVRNTDAAPLVVINQISPISVSFAVPARLLSTLREQRGRGGMKVQVSPAGATDYTAVGTVNFVDNAIDPATDTIRVKATFPNRDRRLWPGAFVDVTLEQSVTPNAIVVPNSAVQASQTGQMVYVVKPDSSVEARPVKLGWTEGDESVVAEGLKAGETVVTDGQLRLTPGAKVTTQSGGSRGQ